MEISNNFWKNKNVFLTGHTGFKGSWISIWLSSLGAKVHGYSLSPPTSENLFTLASLENIISTSTIGDIRNFEKLEQAFLISKADMVLHMAAQPLVRESYISPLETIQTNVMGTANLLEVLRKNENSVRAFLNITTDKVYENREWLWGYRENEALGGYDPYSSSKACSELLTSAYRSSFFNPTLISEHNMAIASARAGNVIGGGDFAVDRLIPDLIRSILNKEKVRIRNPNSVRPWQHVIEPIAGYLMLLQKLYEDGASFVGSWNFGPKTKDMIPVIEIVNKFKEIYWRRYQFAVEYEIANQIGPHEANFLRLDITKSSTYLSWEPKWSINTAFEKIIDWMEAHLEKKNILNICLRQIEEYMQLETEAKN
ncbi:MAG: CDP-glucose 4,6-dehydratase [Leptospira sp.]|nr:CDP-glucose 4,6-dehydratase [Leptospira sp.]